MPLTIWIFCAACDCDVLPLTYQRSWHSAKALPSDDISAAYGTGEEVELSFHRLLTYFALTKSDQRFKIPSRSVTSLPARVAAALEGSMTGGKVRDIGATASGYVFIQSINDFGEVVEYDVASSRGFIYTHGAYVFLDPLTSLPSGSVILSRSINNRGPDSGYRGHRRIGGPSYPNNLREVRLDATIDNNPSKKTISAGANITYTIKATNLDTDTSLFTLNDDLDPTTTVVSCSVNGGGGSCVALLGSQTATVTLPDLTKGSTATITLQVKAAGSYSPNAVIMNTATLRSSKTSDYLSTAYTSVP